MGNAITREYNTARKNPAQRWGTERSATAQKSGTQVGLRGSSSAIPTRQHKALPAPSVASVTHCFHGILAVIICGNQTDITLVVPLHKHDAVLTGPLCRLSLPHLQVPKCIWELLAARMCSATKVCVVLQHSFSQGDWREIVICEHMAVRVQVHVRQTHDDAVFETLALGDVDCCTGVHLKLHAVSGVRITQAPELYPPLYWLQWQILLPAEATILFDYRLIHAEVLWWRVHLAETFIEMDDDWPHFPQLVPSSLLGRQRAVQELAQLLVASLRHDTRDVRTSEYRTFTPVIAVLRHHLESHGDVDAHIRPHVVSGCGVPVLVCCGVRHVWVWLGGRGLGNSFQVRRCRNTAEEIFPNNLNEEAQRWGCCR